MSIIERIAAPFEKIGIKPPVTIAFLTAIVLIVANWIATGEPFDVTQLKAAIAAFLIAAAGAVPPPVVGTTTRSISRLRQ
ncbi:MAG: hypothetical protein EHM90_00525 [Chloroflexi bacterium]|nr:MAG: hypothetical protein EHM90_00525 [Chloroflexota bacterium]